MKLSTKFLTAAIAGSIALGGLTAPSVQAAPAPAATVAASKPKLAPLHLSRMTLCRFEDGSGQEGHGGWPCIWDATVQGNRRGDSIIFVASQIEKGSVADVGLDEITLDQLDAADELAAAIRATPASKRTPAMKAALHHFEQNER